MAKAKIKEKEEEVVGNIPKEMSILDLSVEKRMELYSEVVRKFDEEGVKTYGLSIGAQLKATADGILPRLVLVDMLTKENAKQSNPATKKESAKD